MAGHRTDIVHHLRTPCGRKDDILLHLLHQRHPQPLLEQPALRGSLPASSGLCRRLRRLSALECLQLDHLAHDRYALQTLGSGRHVQHLSRQPHQRALRTSDRGHTAVRETEDSGIVLHGFRTEHPQQSGEPDETRRDPQHR